MAKGILNLAFVGHVDHGKSTLVGRLFDDGGQIPERLRDRLSRQAAALGRPELRFAFFTDTSLEERRRGITIEVAYRELETPQHRLTVIDVPGHQDFLRSCISGVWAADAAVVVLDAQATSAYGLAPQTKEHLVLLKALDIPSLIVAVNKMDAVAFNRECFELCRMELEQFAAEIDYPAMAAATYVPLSAVEGDNVSEPSTRLPWNSGPYLREAIAAIPSPSRPLDSPFRMPIRRTLSVPGVGTVLTGTVACGQLGVGDEVVVVPYPGTGFTRAEVRSMECHHREVEAASAGDDVGILLTRTDKDFLARQVKKGAVLGTAAAPPVGVRSFRAEVRVIDHSSGLRAGYTPYLHAHQAAVPCCICRVPVALGGPAILGSPDEDWRLENGGVGVVALETTKPIVVERTIDSSRLGRFVLRDRRIVAIGTFLGLD